MHIECKDIEACFTEIISNRNSSAINKGIIALEKELSKSCKKEIRVAVIPYTKRDAKLFVMNIIPDQSTIQKIASVLSSAETRLDAISSLWKKTSSWRLDIDGQLFEFLNAQELTALTLHEIGHITETDAIPRRISNIIQFSVATGKVSQRILLGDSKFSKILSIPIICASSFSFDRSGLRKELKADKMAVYNGYLTELVSAMGKIESRLREQGTIDNQDGGLNDSIKYMNQQLENLEKRKGYLVKKDMYSLRKHLPEISYIRESVDELCEYICPNDDGIRMRYLTDLASKMVNDAYVTEFGFGGRLKPIERNQLDYIQIKVQQIQTYNDKMMVVSYINSKIELAHYYLEVLADPKLAKKMKVPHSKDQLERIILILEREKAIAIKKPIEDNTPKIFVSYPSDYEG